MFTVSAQNGKMTVSLLSCISLHAVMNIMTEFAKKNQTVMDIMTESQQIKVKLSWISYTL